MDVLLMIAKRDNPKRFEFFCVHERSAPTLSHPGGEDMCKLVGVRMVLDYGNDSYHDFRQWSNSLLLGNMRWRARRLNRSGGSRSAGRRCTRR